MSSSAEQLCIYSQKTIHQLLTYIITSVVRPFTRIKCHKIKFTPAHKHHAILDCGGVAIKSHTYSVPVAKPDPEVRCSVWYNAAFR